MLPHPHCGTSSRAPNTSRPPISPPQPGTAPPTSASTRQPRPPTPRSSPTFSQTLRSVPLRYVSRFLPPCGRMHSEGHHYGVGSRDVSGYHGLTFRGVFLRDRRSLCRSLVLSRQRLPPACSASAAHGLLPPTTGERRCRRLSVRRRPDPAARRPLPEQRPLARRSPIPSQEDS
jgi:hypothetical protein